MTNIKYRGQQFILFFSGVSNILLDNHGSGGTMIDSIGETSVPDHYELETGQFTFSSSPRGYDCWIFDNDWALLHHFGGIPFRYPSPDYSTSTLEFVVCNTSKNEEMEHINVADIETLQQVYRPDFYNNSRLQVNLEQELVEANLASNETTELNGTATVEAKDFSFEESEKPLDLNNSKDYHQVKRVEVDYASKSAGAIILEHSNNFQGTSHLLEKDVDRYAIIPCSEPKFVVIGLSEDILVKSIVLANYERYSSHTKDFNVAGRSTTVGEWNDLGNYSAEPNIITNRQTFHLDTPTWARYLKIQFLTHYGNEDYCTMSQISVHGSTMLQGFHEQWGDSAETEGADAVNFDESVSTPTVATVEEMTNMNPEYGLTLVSVKEHVDILENTCDVFQCLNSVLDVCPSSLMTDFEKKIVCCSFRMHEVDESFVNVGDDSGMIKSNLLVETELNGCLPGLDKCHSAQVVEPNEITRDLNPEDSEDGKPVVERLKEFGNSLLQRSSNNVSGTGQRHHRPGDQNAHGDEKVQVIDKMIPPISNRDVTGESLHEGMDTSIPKGATQNERKIDASCNFEGCDQKKSLGEKNGLQGHEKAEGSMIWENSTLFDPTDRLHVALLRFPSTTCIEKLNFSKFKSDVLSAKSAFVQGNAASTNSMEPIFKKLTDEIRALQANMGVHDQFIKEVLSCYQNIMFDLIAEIEITRMDHELRISKLETDGSDCRWSWATFKPDTRLRSLKSFVLTSCIPFFSKMRSPIFSIALHLSELLYFIMYEKQSYRAWLTRWFTVLFTLSYCAYKVGFRVVFVGMKRVNRGKNSDDTSFSSDSYVEERPSRKYKSRMKFRNRNRQTPVYVSKTVKHSVSPGHVTASSDLVSLEE